MTREEEIYEIAGIISPDWCKGIDCVKCYANMYFGCCQYVERAKCLYNKGYRNQTDLLKEFVEYLKNKYTKSEKEQIEIYNVYLEEDNRLKSNFHDGCRFGFELARTSIDQDLEKFLEGKENG